MIRSALRDISIFIIVTWALFGIHRGLSFHQLAEQSHTLENTIKFFAVGLWSDLWLACLFAILAALVGTSLRGVHLLTSLVKRSHQERSSFSYITWVLGLFFVALVILTGFHQNYVAFFRYQIIPFHLTYFGDSGFVKANLSTLWSPEVIAIIVCGGITGYAGYRLRRWPKTLELSVPLFATLFLASLLAHNRNIHYRVQWFVPMELQVHYAERLYFHLKESLVPDPLSIEEKEHLGSHLEIDPNLDMDQFLLEAVYPRVGDTSPSQEAIALKGAVQDLSKQNRAPIIITVLMESLRTSEVGSYHPGQESITPVMDRLSREGILFTNAFTTGTVTRGGQEAVWCGYLGSRSTSMMRNRPDIRVPCLPELIDGKSFWIHAGEGAFDNQEAFWTHKKTNHIITGEHFDSSLSATPWGKSDLELYRRSADEIQNLRKSFPGQPLHGIILTLTNHIPWVLPSDAPQAIKDKAKNLGSPQFATTHYADYAVGELIRDLKRRKLWHQTLLFIASDHGVSGHPYHQIAPEKSGVPFLKSHMVLIMTGGLVESAAIGGTTITEDVSQADIPPLISWLMGSSESRFMGEMLLSDGRKRPVVSDLGHQLFAPRSGRLFSRKEQIRSAGPDLRPDDQLALTYYRAFLNLLNSGNLQKHSM